MKLIENWRAELNRLWSVRIALVGTLLPIADALVPALQGHVSPWAYAGLSILIILARLVKQTVPVPKAAP